MKGRNAILDRVSDRYKQKNGRQTRDLLKAAESNGWEVGHIIHAKMSATKVRKANRTDLAKLYKLAAEDKIDRVLITEISRLGRKSFEVQQTVSELKEFNVSVYIHNLQMETITDNVMQQFGVNVMLSVMASMAEMETAQLSERIRSGKAASAARGVHQGRKAGTVEDFGRKIKENQSYRDAARYLESNALSLRQISETTHISINTVRKIKKYISENN